MKRILIVLAVALATVTVRAQDEKLLTGKDLIAWKIARSGMRDDVVMRNCWTIPEDTQPLASTMTKTSTGDYLFRFIVTGREKSASGELLNWDTMRRVYKVRVADLGNMLKFDGCAGMDELK